MLLVKTPALRSWYLYKIAAYFSSLLSLQSLCLHSNAKTPSSVILSQHIATFFFGRLSSIVSTPHTSALIQSLSAEMGKCNFLQKKSFNSYDIRMAGLFFWKGIQLCCNVLDSIGGAESYSVSVSCVGSPASVQGLDSVPAPQSQKNLQHRETALSGHSLLLWEQPHALAGHVPIMSNEFYVMSLMALLDAVHTDGVTVCGVAGVTSGGKSSTLGRNQTKPDQLSSEVLQEAGGPEMYWRKGGAQDCEVWEVYINLDFTARFLLLVSQTQLCCATPWAQVHRNNLFSSSPKAENGDFLNPLLLLLRRAHIYVFTDTQQLF